MSRRKPATRSGRVLVFCFKAWETRERVSKGGSSRSVETNGGGKSLRTAARRVFLFFRGGFFTSEISDARFEA